MSPSRGSNYGFLEFVVGVFKVFCFELLSFFTNAFSHDRTVFLICDVILVAKNFKSFAKRNQFCGSSSHVGCIFVVELLFLGTEKLFLDLLLLRVRLFLAEGKRLLCIRFISYVIMKLKGPWQDCTMPES